MLLVDLDECSPHFSRPEENTTDIFSITFELEMYSFVKWQFIGIDERTDKGLKLMKNRDNTPDNNF